MCMRVCVCMSYQNKDLYVKINKIIEVDSVLSFISNYYRPGPKQLDQSAYINLYL